MTGGAHPPERGEPVGKPKYGHHDDTYPLPERRRDAFGAHGLVGLPSSPTMVSRTSRKAPAPEQRPCFFDARASHTCEG